MTQYELNIIKLPNHIRSIMSGLLLSDDYITFSARSKNGRLSLTQSLAHLDYIYFVYNLLSHYYSKHPVFRERHRYGKSRFSLKINTRSMFCITELYGCFYTKKSKTIKSSIYDELTPIALAH
jgi:hypothetical protein